MDTRKKYARAATVMYRRYVRQRPKLKTYNDIPSIHYRGQGLGNIVCISVLIYSFQWIISRVGGLEHPFINLSKFEFIILYVLKYSNLLYKWVTLIINTVVLCVQEVVNIFYSNLLFKMGNYFLDKVKVIKNIDQAGPGSGLFCWGAIYIRIFLTRLGSVSQFFRLLFLEDLFWIRVNSTRIRSPDYEGGGIRNSLNLH